MIALAVAAVLAAGGWTPMLNGRDLDGWTVHVGKRAPGEDPKQVFRVVKEDGAPALRISGEEWAALTSDVRLENYHLQLEFKWGDARHGERARAPRDSGLLYHADGPPSPANGWMESVEFGILEGGETGDFWSVPGPQGARVHVDVEGEEIPPAQRRYPSQPIRYRSGGRPFQATTSAVLSARDFEKPRGQWNRLDLYCLGQTAVHVVNGQVALVLTNIQKKVDGAFAPLTAGRIQLQSEGAETYVRNVRHRPLAALPAALKRYVPAANALTPGERAEGWQLLFDGRSLAGFRGLEDEQPPPGWKVEDGAIVLGRRSGDLMTARRFGAFELSLEWKLGEGGNSGIYYQVDGKRGPLAMTAPEYELRDNRFWPEDPYKTGGNYGLHVPTSSPTRPVGQWNHTRIVMRGQRVEHWLNGALVVSYERLGPKWQDDVRKSKFRNTPSYARVLDGHILFQDHGTPVAFRNVKVRPLAPDVSPWVKGEATAPAARAGWTTRLVAEPPVIKHPSVVEVAPDGRVFVAEDPMDISAPADAKLGRIVVLHPDGRSTVFAEGLHAVFGLAYLEGKLYVLHNPKLSVFDDDPIAGVGRNRRELIEQTHPVPWSSGWNDHVPANFRLAMDGYFYMAVGDKGMYGAVGRDGKRLDLAGGGIVRLRPDGTGLEVFSTGVRNIMDVALDAEDELFTYDNTDEQQWMSRLTHMVDGGFYGYPYDFIPRRPYTLWMMADYGGGAATGALAYTEDALPEEFAGNLLLADFGKRQVLRVPVERAGATFRPKFREDLFPLPPHDFRPVGMAVSPDGLSLYVCDWNHTDNKERVEVGRLYQVTWTGPSRARPRPAWYQDAAMGRPIAAPLSELVQALRHPARSVRLVAQRRLGERGGAAVPSLRALLADRQAPRHARWHAVWALDAVDGGARGRAEILAAARDPDPSLRRQAIRQLGTRRVRAARPLLVAALKDGDASVRFHAATALGRIGDTAALPALAEALAEEDGWARFAAFTALRRLGQADARVPPRVARLLDDERPRVREAASFALREVYDEKLADALAALARGAARPDTRRLAIALLAEAHRQRPPWTGAYWGTHPAYAPHPRKTVAWAATPRIAAALEEALADGDAGVRRASVQGIAAAQLAGAGAKLRAAFATEPDAEVRRALLDALVALADPGIGPLLARLIRGDEAAPELRARAVEAAARAPGAEVETALIAVLGDRRAERPLLVGAVNALGARRAVAALAPLTPYTRHADEEVRRAALLAVAAIGGPSAAGVLAPMLRDPSPGLRRDAVTAVGALAERRLVPELLAAYRDPALRTDATLALARVPDLRALEVYLDGLTARSPDARAASARALGAIAKEALPVLEKRAMSLPPAAVAALQEIYDRDLRARKGPLFAANAIRYEAADYLAHALKNAGDADHGRKLFADDTGVACARCHKVRGQGGDVGPDLTTIGAQSARQTLAESILYPSRVVREGYQQTVIELADGGAVEGIVRGETPEVVTLRDAQGRTHVVPRPQIKTRQTSDVSLMPEGLHAGLSPQDFADLVSYLETLR